MDIAKCCNFHKLMIAKFSKIFSGTENSFILMMNQKLEIANSRFDVLPTTSIRPPTRIKCSRPKVATGSPAGDLDLQMTPFQVLIDSLAYKLTHLNLAKFLLLHSAHASP